MNRRSVFAVLLAAFVALFVLPSIAHAALMPVYRFYNVNEGVHLYTADETEKNNVMANLSSIYRYEGVGYSIERSDPLNSNPLYRFYNFQKGVHFYTSDETEKSNVQGTLAWTYKFEGVGYGVSRTPTAMPIYRFLNVNKGVHFYTATTGEKDWVIANLGSIYRYEGIAFYITGSIPPWTPPPPPPAVVNFMANSNTGKFHKLSCSWVDQILPEHRVGYPSREACLAAGYIPCLVCNP